MKLNNKGFAISTIMYMILIMAVILITVTLSLLGNRKLILDKAKNEALNNIYIPEPVSFSEDSWEIIAANVKAKRISKYNIGDTKEVTLTGKVDGTYTVRISNISTPYECNQGGYSQTACGFVVESADIITTHAMNDADTNVGGYPASSIYPFLQNDIYESLPEDLRNVIIDTKVVSSHGPSDSTNFTSTDKLYLLSTKEVWGESESGDTVKEETRQLDYYKNIGVTTSNYLGAIKQYNGSNYPWWLRSADSNSADYFYGVYYRGEWGYGSTYNADGVAPAFRIG